MKENMRKAQNEREHLIIKHNEEILSLKQSLKEEKMKNEKETKTMKTELSSSKALIKYMQDIMIQSNEERENILKNQCGDGGAMEKIKNKEVEHGLLTPWAALNGFELKEELVLQNSTLLTTLPFIGKQYTVSFEVFINKLPSTFENIIRFTIWDYNTGTNGGQTPGVWISYDKKFFIVSSVNGDGSHRYEGTSVLSTNNWIHVEISQKLISDKVMYSISINKKKVYSVENTDPRQFIKVNVYASDPWHKALDGKIKNLKVETQ